MIDREKVINCLTEIEQIMVCRQEICPREELQYWIELQEGVADALALLKEQEGIINELLDLGYPHNFQHEAPWVVDYLYELTEIIKKAFKARESR